MKKLSDMITTQIESYSTIGRWHSQLAGYIINPGGNNMFTEIDMKSWPRADLNLNVLLKTESLGINYQWMAYIGIFEGFAV